jgi:hypothetical protein
VGGISLPEAGGGGYIFYGPEYRGLPIVAGHQALAHWRRRLARVLVRPELELDGGGRDALGGAGEADLAAGHLAGHGGVLEDARREGAHLHPASHLDHV